MKAADRVWLRRLKATLRREKLVRIDRRPVTKDMIDGYVVGANERFVFVHILDANYKCLDGYCVVRTDDIKRYRVWDDWESIDRRALKLKGYAPAPLPDVSLEDWPSLLRTANRLFPLIVIHREKMDDEVCSIGRVAKLTDKTVTLEEIDPAARWEGTRRFRFADITQVGFGGAYEESLWLVAEDEKAKPKAGKNRP